MRPYTASVLLGGKAILENPTSAISTPISLSPGVLPSSEPLVASWAMCASISRTCFSVSGAGVEKITELVFAQFLADQAQDRAAP